jgi:hypothetical protein
LPQGPLGAHALKMNTPARQARFGVLVNGCVAHVRAISVHAVLALDEAHDHLVTARVVAVSLPSQRWHHLLDHLSSEVFPPESPPAGSGPDNDEHTDRFAHGLFTAAAAFLAAEANDLEDRIPLLGDEHHTKEIRERLQHIADQVGQTTDALIEELENRTWRQLPKIRSQASDPSPPELTPPPTPGSRPTLAKMVLPMAAGSLGVVIAIIVDNLRRNAPLTMVIITSAGLLICLGLLLGGSWTRQALRADYRLRAEQRRQLSEQWQALRAAHHHNRCPRCTSPLSPYDPDHEPTIDHAPHDDDWQQYVK